MAVPRRRLVLQTLTDEDRRVLRFALQLLRSSERPPSQDERARLADALFAMSDADEATIAAYSIQLGGREGFAGAGGADEMAISEIEKLLAYGITPGKNQKALTASTPQARRPTGRGETSPKVYTGRSRQWRDAGEHWLDANP
jgi:hypothetical protein